MSERENPNSLPSPEQILKTSANVGVPNNNNNNSIFDTSEQNNSNTTNNGQTNIKTPSKGIAALVNSQNREPQKKFIEKTFYQASEEPKPLSEFFGQKRENADSLDNNSKHAPLSPNNQMLFALPSVEQLSRENMVKIEPLHQKQNNSVANNNNEISNNQNFQPIDQGGFQTTNESGVEHSRRHAMDFLHKVRMAYLDYPEVYNNFLEIMKSVQQENIDTLSVIARVKDLFKDNEHLLEDFNTFLPIGYKIDHEDEQKAQSDLDHARSYVRKIKNRFANRPNTYKAFLEILHSYYQGQRPINEVLEEVGELFANHADLLTEFRLFLPKTADMMTATGTSSEKTRKKRDKVRTYNKRRNESPESPIQVQSPPPRKTMDRRPIDYEKEERILKKVQEKKRKIESLEDQKKKNFTKIEYKTRIYQEFRFFMLLKQRTDKSVYQNLMHILRMYTEELLTKENLDFLTKQLFRNCQDLYFYFLQFISFDTNHLVDLKLNHFSLNNNEEKEIEFNFEEYLDEVQILIDLNGRTIRELQRIVEEIHSHRSFDYMIHLDHIHLKNIQRIYGSATSEIINSLTKDPLVVAPVILKRLRQKQIEWSEIEKEEEEEKILESAMKND